MNDLFKWLVKGVLSMIVWVFILSIRWNGRPIYYYAQDVLVKNSIVKALDAEIGEIWWRLTNKNQDIREKTM